MDTNSLSPLSKSPPKPSGPHLFIPHTRVVFYIPASTEINPGLLLPPWLHATSHHLPPSISLMGLQLPIDVLPALLYGMLRPTWSTDGSSRLGCYDRRSAQLRAASQDAAAGYQRMLRPLMVCAGTGDNGCNYICDDGCYNR